MHGLTEHIPEDATREGNAQGPFPRKTSSAEPHVGSLHPSQGTNVPDPEQLLAPSFPGRHTQR